MFSESIVDIGSTYLSLKTHF